MEDSYTLTDELNLLDPTTARLYHDEFDDLVLEVAGRDPKRGILVVRCFPISAGNRFIALCTPNKKELGIVENLAALDPDSRKTLADALARAYFRPQITAVYTITEEHHIPRWQVDTDRGPAPSRSAPAAATSACCPKAGYSSATPTATNTRSPTTAVWMLIAGHWSKTKCNPLYALKATPPAPALRSEIFLPSCPTTHSEKPA